MQIDQLQRLKKSTEKGLRMRRIADATEETLREAEDNTDESLRNNLLYKIQTETGTASQGRATSAAKYVRWMWPNTKVNLLDLVASLLEGQSTHDLENRSLLCEQARFSRCSGNGYLHIEPAGFSVGFEFDNLEDMLESGWTCFRIKGSLDELVETA